MELLNGLSWRSHCQGRTCSKRSKHTDNGFLYNLVKFVAPSQAMQANQAKNKPLHNKPVNISLEVEVINLIFVLSGFLFG